MLNVDFQKLTITKPGEAVQEGGPRGSTEGSDLVSVEPSRVDFSIANDYG
jgi:hypothetical protein